MGGRVNTQKRDGWVIGTFNNNLQISVVWYYKIFFFLMLHISNGSFRGPGRWKFHHLVAVKFRIPCFLNFQGKRRKRLENLTRAFYSLSLEVAHLIFTFHWPEWIIWLYLSARVSLAVKGAIEMFSGHYCLSHIISISRDLMHDFWWLMNFLNGCNYSQMFILFWFFTSLNDSVTNILAISLSTFLIVSLG